MVFCFIYVPTLISVKHLIVRWQGGYLLVNVLPCYIGWCKDNLCVYLCNR